MKQTIAQQIKWDFKANDELVIKDKNGKLIYFEYSNGVWVKYEYDSQGNLIYRENSFGRIIDKRPKPCEGKIVEIGGEKFKLVKV
jgi:YD repeat-containing protein